MIGEFDRGRLSIAGEMLTLTLNSGTIIQEITYDDESPWPTSADGEGQRLSIIDLTGNTDPLNWRASNTMGGTPGMPHWEGAPPLSTELPTISVTDKLMEVNGETDLYWQVRIDAAGHDPNDFLLEFSDNLSEWRSSDIGFEVMETLGQSTFYRSTSPTAQSKTGFLRLRRTP